MLIRLFATMLMVLCFAAPALAADLSARIQASRMTVLDVNQAAGTVRCIMHSAMTVGAAVIYADDRQISLSDLKVGDFIKVESQENSIQKIHVLRRAAEETASLER
jgi:hypothetical protein